MSNALLCRGLDEKQAMDIEVNDLPKGNPKRPHCMVVDPDVDPSCLVNIDGKIRYQEKEQANDPRLSFWDIKKRPSA